MAGVTADSTMAAGTVGEVTSAEETSVAAGASAGGTSVGEVTSAEETSVAAVTSAEETSVAAVTSEAAAISAAEGTSGAVTSAGAISRALIALLVSLLVLAAPAGAKSGVEEAASALKRHPVYVAPDAELASQVDVEALKARIKSADAAPLY